MPPVLFSLLVLLVAVRSVGAVFRPNRMCALAVCMSVHPMEQIAAGLEQKAERLMQSPASDQELQGPCHGHFAGHARLDVSSLED